MLLSPAPDPRVIHAADGVDLATYEFGNAGAPPVLAVHGFASSASANWLDTGWVRDVTRAGFRVIGYDQRGHGASGKPHSPSAYSVEILAADVDAVLHAYCVDRVAYLGYSLGARVGWQAAHIWPRRITRAVLGGIPSGDPLRRFRLDSARDFIAHGAVVSDRLTSTYLDMAGRIPGNDLEALVALVEGMRGGTEPSALNAPAQPVLFATGSEDRILPASQELAGIAPRGRFFEIPGRNHFNAPTARPFRSAAIAFLAEQNA
ncbi:alpha/beta fold hydrolase [Cryobacterium tepidiphilum]|uniref:Alpha/beta hydrolase n=1 Tax=Cryobacterium tepidiphilum TaxID=2486026 RepID=A0A3M8LLU9_9MICO|nr:alpha/beta hydrolase [Cryobacterium tepidiphilum]RNE66450.1 alpha/beta hydrolase [Cryobacterium tepidiphilum]